MRKLRILMMLAVLAITLPAPAQTTEASQGFQLSGRIVDALTGKPLSKMVVEIGKPLGTEAVASVTTGVGRALRVHQPGTREVLARRARERNSAAGLPGAWILFDGDRGRSRNRFRWN